MKRVETKVAVVTVAMLMLLAGVANAQDTTREWESFLIGEWKTVASIHFGRDHNESNPDVSAGFTPDSWVTVYQEDGTGFLRARPGDQRGAFSWWVVPYGDAFCLIQRDEIEEGTHFELQSVLQNIDNGHLMVVYMVHGTVLSAAYLQRDR